MRIWVPKGSMTIFMTLMLCVMISMISTGLWSVQTAAARTQILNGVDIGLYSLFAQYDRTLLSEYDIFALDASGQDGKLDLASVYDDFSAYMLPVFMQNSQKLIVLEGGLGGYALLTDDGGDVFYHEAVRYMQETLWAQGITALQNRLGGRQASLSEAEAAGERLEHGNTMGDYDNEMNSAAQRSQEAERQRAAQSSSGDGSRFGGPGGQGGDGFAGSDGSGGTVPFEEAPAGASGPENPIPTIKRIRNMDLLMLVMPPTKSISSRDIRGKVLLSGRVRQQGMGMIGWYQPDGNVLNDLLFHQYVMSKLPNFLRPASSGLVYQVEYLIGRKTSDRENLERVVKRLLLIREGANAIYLAGDSEKMTQVKLLASAIAGTFLVPPAAVVIEAALVACWAFAESILDVRELLSGGKIPLKKTPADWQLSLENLPTLLDRLDTDRRSSPDGLSYQEYLEILLMGVDRREKLKGMMDMIELTLRDRPGWEEFRLDSCVVGAKASVDVLANGSKVFLVERMFGYE